MITRCDVLRSCHWKTEERKKKEMNKDKKATPQKDPSRKTKRPAEPVTSNTPMEPIEASDEEIAEVLDSLGPHVIKEDRFNDLLEDLADEKDDDLTGAHELAPVEAEGDEPRVHAPQLVEASSTLLAHCGTQKITRAELAVILTPEGTRTHQPLSHYQIIEALIEALSFRHIQVVRDEYAVSADGLRMFGVLDTSSAWDGCCFSIGIRNSNDKTMRLALTAGFRVLVCDNMAFAGDFKPVFHKHTRKLDLLDVISIGVDKMQRNFAPLKEKIRAWQQLQLTDAQAKLIIYGAFLERGLPVPRRLLPIVHRHYFEPQYEAFERRTLWSLSNAFTSAFKALKPVTQFQATAKLGVFLAQKEAEALNNNVQTAAAQLDEETTLVMNA